MQNTFEHGGNIHRLRRNQQVSAQPFLDFSANINPLGLPESVIFALRTALPDIVHYPDPEGYALKTQIAASYALEYARLVLGNGAVELLYVLCHTLRPKNVLIPVPAFSEYERAARSSKARIHYLFLEKENGFALDIHRFISHLHGIDLCFLGNPNNPTGVLITVNDLETIAEAAQAEGCFVVVDESFMDFLPNAELYTCRSLLKKFSNLILLQSLTKFFAIPGLRLGFMACEPQLASDLCDSKDPWNVNSLAQIAGITALKDTVYQIKSKTALYNDLPIFYEQLKEIPQFITYQPTVNFVLLELDKTNFTVRDLKECMEKRGILIRDCGNYPGLTKSFFRVAIKTCKENNILIKNIKEVLE